VNPNRFPAALNDRSDSGKLLNVDWGRPTRAIGAKRSEKTWAEFPESFRTGSGWGAKELLDFVIKVLENFLEATQLTDETFCLSARKADTTFRTGVSVIEALA
jgi:hypothetical protein